MRKQSFLSFSTKPRTALRQRLKSLRSRARFACSNGFGKSLEVILPKLRDGYIVPEADVARGLALENPDAFFLSQAGECFHNVTVTGGKQRAEGPLSMKRELREVLRQLEDLERALRDEEMRVLTLGREIKDLTSLLDRLDGEQARSRASGHDLRPHAAAARLRDDPRQRAPERLSARIASPRHRACRAGKHRHRASVRNRRRGRAPHPARTANRRRAGIA